MARTDGKRENQHYVPKMLLRNFSFKGRGKEGQLYVFDKHSNASFRTGISKVAAEGGFYDFSDGKCSLSLEQHFTELEHNTTEAFARLISSKNISVLTEEEKAWIGIFVIAQHIRVRHFRESIKHFDELISKRIRQMGGDPTKIGGYTPFDGDDDVKLFSLQFFTKNILEWSDLALQKKWLLFEAPLIDPFLISDNPVTLHNDTDMSPYGNIGLAVPNIQIYLPLTPTLTLALWCPNMAISIINHHTEILRQIEERRAFSTLGAHRSANENYKILGKLEQMVARSGPIVDGLERGVSVACNNENIMFMNSLQVMWSERFVMSSKDNFALVRRMIADNKKFRHGKRIEIN